MILVLDSIERNIDNTGWWVWLPATDGIRIVFPIPFFVPDKEEF